MPLPTTLKLNADKRSRLGGQLLRLAKRYDRELQERLSRWNLAPTHYEILKLLYAAPDYSMSHSQLAQGLGVTLPSVTLAIRKLGAMKMVGSQRGEDRRRRLVTLSVKGAETLALLYDEYERFAEELFSSIDDRKANSLERTIGRLLSRLSELQDTPNSSAA
jgi:MarR family transcriptional regulator, lower aerobic nicotinate degradation pathway regulator